MIESRCEAVTKNGHSRFSYPALNTIGKKKITFKEPNKNAADNTLFFYFYISKEIRLDVSCESLMSHVNPLRSRGFT